MQIAIFGNTAWIKYLTAALPAAQWMIATNEEEFLSLNADAYFTQANHYKNGITGKPFFVDAVADTLQDLQAPENVLRFNGWNGFVEKPFWEMAGNIDDNVTSILQHINKQPIVCADEPGFISARTFAMIVNEAYFALAEGVSTKKEIDIAMKLGTNYPFGPFEWAEKIGLKNIAALLQKLSATDERYLPSSLLLNETI